MSHSKHSLPSWSIWLPSIIIAAMSFVLSFNALRAYGESVNFCPAYLFPAILDGFMLACSWFATFRSIKGRSDSLPRVLLWVFTGLSILIQVSFSTLAVGSVTFSSTNWHCWVDLISHGLAPMTLLFSVEMVLADYRDDDKDRSRKEKRESRVKDSQEKGEIPTASAVNQAIAIHGSNRAAAKALNISESTLYRIKGQNSN